MKYCIHCGAEIPDDSIFCDHCGKRTEEALEAPSQPQKKKSSPQKGKKKAPAGESREQPREENKRGWKLFLGRDEAPLDRDSTAITMPRSVDQDPVYRASRWLLALVALLMVVFAGTLAYNLYCRMGFGDNKYKNIPVIYVQGDNTLKFSSPLVEEPVTITQSLNWGNMSLEEMTCLSEDGKDLLYLNNYSSGSGDLYLRNTDSDRPRYGEKEDKGVKVDENVVPGQFFWSSDGKYAIYRKNDGDLYRWRKNKAVEKLDTQIEEIVAVTTSGQVIYTKAEEGAGEGVTLYSKALDSNDDDKLKLDTGVSQIFSCNADGSSIYYGKPSGDEHNPWDVYRYTPKGGSEKLAGMVAQLLDYNDKGELFFTRAEPTEIDPFQYFVDDMAETDAQITEEPQLSDYNIEKTTIWGVPYTVPDYEGYQAALEAYQAKLKRDEIREAIAGESRTITTYQLFHKAGSSETRLDFGIRWVESADAGTGNAVYTKERVTSGQSVLISDVEDAEDAIRLLSAVNGSAVQDYYWARVGKEPTVFVTATNEETVSVTLDPGRGVYYLLIEQGKEGGTLTWLPVEQEGLGVSRKTDDDVYAITDIFYGNRMLYYRDVTGEKGTLCGANAGSKEKLSEGASEQLWLEENGSAMMLLRDYSQELEMGELILYRDSNRRVATDAHAYSYRTRNYIYVQRSYNTTSEKGDLYLYTGNDQKLTLLDYDVTDFG